MIHTDPAARSSRPRFVRARGSNWYGKASRSAALKATCISEPAERPTSHPPLPPRQPRAAKTAPARMRQLQPEAPIPTRPSRSGPSNLASEEPPRRGGAPPPLGGTRSEACCSCPKAWKARPSRVLASPRPLDPVASPRAAPGPRLPGSRLSCQSDADFPHGQQTNQRAGVLFGPSARRLFGPSARPLFGPSARRLFGPSACRSSAFRGALKRGSRWFRFTVGFFFFFQALPGAASLRNPTSSGRLWSAGSAWKSQASQRCFRKSYLERGVSQTLKVSVARESRSVDLRSC